MYWEQKRGERALPAREQIDPVDFAFILGNVLLVEVVHDPLRFRVRLHGSNMVRRAGFDVTGKWMEDYPDPEYGRVAIASFTHTVNMRGPFYRHNERVLGGRERGYETLMLPLSSDGEIIDMLLIGLIYDDA